MNSPPFFGAGHKRCGLGRGSTSAERASSLPPPTLNKMARLKERGKMYDYEYDEDRAGYDYLNDGGESKARKKWARYDLEEFSQWDKDAFIKSEKNYTLEFCTKACPLCTVSRN